MSASGYAGDLAPEDAWRLLAAEAGAVLVDVRTDAEWNFVGLPDLAALGKEPVLVPWQEYPGMARNPRFIEALAGHVNDRGVPVIFLCRSGARSRAAAIAATEAGFAACYNLAGGFEGDPDEHGHRGRRNGWKAAGLDWRQG